MFSRNSASVARASNTQRRLPGGFTLIELLVVVGIIALLMAILLPALGRARQEAMKISCGANMRQWGTAVQTFGMDNKGQFPNPGIRGGSDTRPFVFNDDTSVKNQWLDFNAQYLTILAYDAIESGEGSVQWCPTLEIHRTEPEYKIGYVYLPHRSNGDAVYDPDLAGWLRPRLDGATRKAPFMADLYARMTGDPESVTEQSSHGGNDNTTAQGGNFLFEDGSVRWHAGEGIEIGANDSEREYFFVVPVPGLLNEL